MALTVVATIIAKHDAIETVKSELHKMIAPTRQESGCIEYRMHQDQENPALFIFYENWENLASLEQHLNSAHFQSCFAAIGSLILEPVIKKMTEVLHEA